MKLCSRMHSVLRVLLVLWAGWRSSRWGLGEVNVWAKAGGIPRNQLGP